MSLVGERSAQWSRSGEAGQIRDAGATQRAWRAWRRPCYPEIPSSGGGMNYEEFFKQRLDALRAEGRYRVFADLERRCGRFPAPGTTGSAPRSRCGARTTISAWASTRTCWPR